MPASVSWSPTGKFVPPSIIGLFPRGIINIHPSLLPKHRGPTPLESVILDGDRTTGVTLMQLAAAMDSGAIVAQETVALRGDETKQALTDQLSNLGRDMLLEHLPAVIAGSSQATAQDESQAQYDQLIAKDAGRLDAAAWQRPVATLERQIRAYAGWPRSRTTIGATDIIITQAHVAPGRRITGQLVAREQVVWGPRQRWRTRYRQFDTGRQKRNVGGGFFGRLPLARSAKLAVWY